MGCGASTASPPGGAPAGKKAAAGSGTTGGKDGQLLEAAKKGNTSEALRLIEQEGVNVNCTNSVRRSGEESTARAAWVWGGEGKRRQRHIV